MVNMRDEVFALNRKETFMEGKSSYDDVMDKVLKHTTLNQGNIEAIMNRIAWHESAKSMSPSQKQKGGGPGRGIFQYELSTIDKETGKIKQGAGRTAMNRLYSVLGGKLPTDTEKGANISNMPKWMEPYFKKDINNKWVANGDVDFSKLTATQQRTLFLADKLKTKGAIPSLKVGDIEESNWWAEFHHKGDESNISGFQEDSKAFKNRGFIIPK